VRTRFMILLMGISLGLVARTLFGPPEVEFPPRKSNKPRMVAPPAAQPDEPPAADDAKPDQDAESEDLNRFA